MRRWNPILLGVAFMAIAVVTWSSTRAQQPGLGERIGERVDDAASAVKRGVDRAGDSIRNEFHKAKASINAMGIEGRVYGRIRWDKALEGASIDVSAAKDGTVTLTGSTLNLAGKSKAVELAMSTMGVTNVVDQLTVASSPAP